MRSRSNSGVKLDSYAKIIQKSILKYQDTVTGLFTSSKEVPHAWVRDNLYSIQAVWGLSLAYRKQADLDEDKAKCYELEQSVVKCMRSLLQCMIRQVDKVERFKATQSPCDSLHAKYNKRSCGAVVGDNDWGHLQLDATGLYILMLAQMTAAGLQIIYSLDEVAFVQNLVFYISTAYRTPDYGIWERGDKTNHGVPELNATSVGMCKAAMEAIDELNLFGPSGGSQSVINVTPDEKALCNVILQSMLPRESNSKEIDAGLLSILTYPAFAVTDLDLVNFTKEVIIDKLQGRYGCRRFLRDGYKTALEDPNRLHYELAELKAFEHIECEWPMFWAYFILDGIFTGNSQQVEEYVEAMDEILVVFNNGDIRCVPELYTVPSDKVDAERKNPHSQDRVATGKVPHLWGHSLYMLGKLLREGFIQPGEIDPLNRRYATTAKSDIVVQIALLAEEKIFQSMLKQKLGIHVETEEELAPILCVRPARVLSTIYTMLGKCPKLQLSGRPNCEIGVLGTSKLYTIRGKTYLFTPNFLDQRDFYMSLDTDMLIDMMITELQYLNLSWNTQGRPLVVIPLHQGMLADNGRNFKPSLMSSIKKIQSGYIVGVRVVLGTLTNFLCTSCVTELTFLEVEENDEVEIMQNLLLSPARRLNRLAIRDHVTSDASTSSLTTRQRERTTSERYLDAADTPAPRKHQPRRMSLDLTDMLKIKGDPIDEDYCVGARSYDMLLGADDACAKCVDKLRITYNIADQVELLQQLYTVKGLDWDTRIDGQPGASVADLIEEVYYRAGQQRHWMVVRQMTGLLHKRVNGLAQAVTDLLVRQKQVTVGLPQEPKETTITRPMPVDELHNIIIKSFEGDTEITVLAQEIIMYLGMFIRANPTLFSDLLRLRVGLIIQVMASELTRHLSCTGEEASIFLMSLSPFEMKQLIHNILSGKEFGVVKSVAAKKHTTATEQISIQFSSSKRDKMKLNTLKERLKKGDLLAGLISPPSWRTRHASGETSPESRRESNTSNELLFALNAQSTGQKRGHWLRRRRIDGALNRVPCNFYTRIWRLLEKCYGLVVAGRHIPGYVTKEMTPKELKFALLVENVFNNIPQPEYRQLMVETLTVLSLLADNPRVPFIGDNLTVDRVLVHASNLFYQDEVDDGADEPERDPFTDVCTEFYDCAPSGPHGTITYISKAVASVYQNYLPETTDECVIT